ncbi:DUF4062 domain-containing protein [Chryseobacterium vrystaatense]|uniref:DUF4062 domain-containing protein n=1 Tax=Chryseobacterium vrystaatense TaxID=307480 RepID=A0ABR4UJT9_9FLAO|nr:DUF4062 domain-containing protein [Chryseobacterium vrystaatense]KFF24891.1 hypothetical protein IW16_18370 [Chryseobacterium vrystaatense]
MAKPRIFLSSTFYDLRQIRNDLDIFIDNLGYDIIRNEEGNIPYGKDEALEEYCYKEIKSIDILVSIIGGRFGTESKRGSNSISQIELKTALKEQKQVYIFIDKNVLSEYETYLINKENDIVFKYTDDVRIYHFIEEIKSLPNNNNIKGFETASEITRYLKEQFAGLFQRFLEEQTRIREVSLIQNLEKTAQTLNKLVNFLSDENKDKDDEINKILMINHPFTEDLKAILDIPYNFYIEGFNDLTALLKARFFKLEDPNWEKDLENYYLFVKRQKAKIYTLLINHEIFDDDDKLKFIRRTDWNAENIDYSIEDDEDDDDLPF